jgi:hypothetical protein
LTIGTEKAEKGNLMNRTRSFTVLIAIIALPLLLYACDTQPDGPPAPGSIAGRVYFDQDANQSCETCECGIEYVRIRLYEDACSGYFIQTRYTDEDGFFSFEDLEPQTYCVKSDLPVSCDGFLPTTTTNQTVEVISGEQTELEWFGYESYIETINQ